jgi:hypothetical protein
MGCEWGVDRVSSFPSLFSSPHSARSHTFKSVAPLADPLGYPLFLLLPPPHTPRHPPRQWSARAPWNSSIWSIPSLGKLFRSAVNFDRISTESGFWATNFGTLPAEGATPSFVCSLPPSPPATCPTAHPYPPQTQVAHASLEWADCIELLDATGTSRFTLATELCRCACFAGARWVLRGKRGGVEQNGKGEFGIRARVCELRDYKLRFG